MSFIDFVQCAAKSHIAQCRAVTFKPHADTEALLEAAVRTAFPLHLVHQTLLVVDTHVHLLVLNRTLEETFTPPTEVSRRLQTRDGAGSHFVTRESSDPETQLTR